jgi:hypothetical protein
MMIVKGIRCVRIIFRYLRQYLKFKILLTVISDISSKNSLKYFPVFGHLKTQPYRGYMEISVLWRFENDYKLQLLTFRCLFLSSILVYFKIHIVWSL